MGDDDVYYGTGLFQIRGDSEIDFGWFMGQYLISSLILA